MCVTLWLKSEVAPKLTTPPYNCYLHIRAKMLSLERKVFRSGIGVLLLAFSSYTNNTKGTHLAKSSCSIEKFYQVKKETQNILVNYNSWLPGPRGESGPKYD